MAMTDERLRLSVHIGGTFTGVVLDRGSSSRISTKVRRTHAAPEIGLLDGVSQLCQQAAVSMADVDLLLHGTTLATNAIIERRGARTALLTTKGIGDTVEIGTENRHDQYDIFLKEPVPLVARDLRFTVAERIDVNGNPLLPLDDNEVEARANELLDLDVQSVAISFIHASANGENEQRARDIISRRAPNISISISSEVCPEVREYERVSMTVANAYVCPVMANYLSRLEGVVNLSRLGRKNGSKEHSSESVGRISCDFGDFAPRNEPCRELFAKK
jgi:N-methylhydantoinase A